jgi:hypothetical protein
MISRWMTVVLVGGVLLLAPLAVGSALADEALPPALVQQLDSAAAQGQDGLIAAVKAEVTANPDLAPEIAGYAAKLMPSAGDLILTAVLDVLPPDLAYKLTPSIVAAIEQYAPNSLAQFHLPTGAPPTLPPAENPTPTVASPS